LTIDALHWRLGGRVQGVGFRPFVYRIAQHCRVRGWVRNCAGEVEIVAQGEAEALRRFGHALLREAPPLARPEILSTDKIVAEPFDRFEIRDSQARATDQIHLPPDYFTCDQCLAELDDPSNRRYRYPFINCTQCGPRYTLIASLPYDRPNTSMAGFPLCPRCRAEYENPDDRRFHAEPIACPDCGPEVQFRRAGVSLVGDEALRATIAALRAGGIVAVKGVGGYHLLCDATNPAAVNLLRARKRRPDKPFAVMFPLTSNLAALHDAVVADASHEALLRDPVRPIVLLAKKKGSDLATEIAPGCGEIGAMLPYSPLHYLLLEDFGAPLVATSGNVSGEPVLIAADEAEQRLADIADAFLHHNRPILRPADDPVYRVIAGAPARLRMGRGNAPLEIALPVALERPMLALGGHLKSTIALGWDRRAVLSPHLGDMDAPRSLTLLQQVAADLQSLYGITAERIICDAHPGYATTRLARRWGLPVTPIFHHRAHASALAGELDPHADWLVFAWDGAGYGEDGTIWGGEALLGRPGRWQRVASWRPFSLLGGERVAREPWRSAQALAWETGTNGPEDESTALLRQAWEHGINCPRTSSVGRLFDAAAALTGLCAKASYEGQAPIRLEAACDGEAEAIPLPLVQQDGVWRNDWAPLLAPLADPARSIGERASLFHASMAQALIDQACKIRDTHGITRLGLTGGVFQNRVLSEMVRRQAEAAGFSVASPKTLPCNDAGLSFGQLVEAGALA
jgi:hydrogenase maturation protein HypF